MTVTPHNATERARRAGLIQESRAALDQGQTLEQRAKHREDRADDWARWLHEKMDLVVGARNTGGGPLV
jgi:hypothetical protein